MIDPSTGQSSIDANNPLLQAFMNGHQGGGAMGIISQMIQMYMQQKIPEWQNQQTQASSIGADLKNEVTDEYKGYAPQGAGGGVY